MIRLLLGATLGWALAIALFLAVPSIGLWGIAAGFGLAGLGGFVAAATFR